MSTPTTLRPGDECVASVWVPEGLATAAGVVTRVDGDTVFVRLVGFLPTHYQAGDVFPLDAARVRPVTTLAMMRHHKGLVTFQGGA